jgi:hypothetical protein
MPQGSAFVLRLGWGTTVINYSFQHSSMLILFCTEPSILIATRSYSLPSPMPNNSDFDASSLSLPAEMTPQYSSDLDMLSMEWENIGEESFINISELQLKFDGTQLSKS